MQWRRFHARRQERICAGDDWGRGFVLEMVSVQMAAETFFSGGWKVHIFSERVVGVNIACGGKCAFS